MVSLPRLPIPPVLLRLFALLPDALRFLFSLLFTHKRANIALVLFFLLLLYLLFSRLRSVIKVRTELSRSLFGLHRPPLRRLPSPTARFIPRTETSNFSHISPIFCSNSPDDARIAIMSSRGGPEGAVAIPKSAIPNPTRAPKSPILESWPRVPAEVSPLPQESPSVSKRLELPARFQVDHPSARAEILCAAEGNVRRVAQRKPSGPLPRLEIVGGEVVEFSERGEYKVRKSDGRLKNQSAQASLGVLKLRYDTLVQVLQSSTNQGGLAVIVWHGRGNENCEFGGVSEEAALGRISDFAYWIRFAGKYFQEKGEEQKAWAFVAPAIRVFAGEKEMLACGISIMIGRGAIEAVLGRAVEIAQEAMAGVAADSGKKVKRLVIAAPDDQEAVQEVVDFFREKGRRVGFDEIVIAMRSSATGFGERMIEGLEEAEAEDGDE